mgnify:FL=1
MPKQFTWFEKLGEAVEQIPRDKGDELIAALVRYGSFGEEPEFDDWGLEGLFTVLRGDIDNSLKARYENKGGRPKKQEVPEDDKPPVKVSNKQGVSNKQEPPVPEDDKPPVSVYENLEETPGSSAKETPSYIRKEKIRKDKDLSISLTRNSVEQDPEDPIPYSEIIGYLNERIDSDYRPSAERNKKPIRARWAEGYRVDDFKTVIDLKAAEWLGDPKMSNFLRPTTLFGPKFEDYLNAAPLALKAKESGTLQNMRPDYSGEGWW